MNKDNFTGKWGFIIACMGSAIGMGNLWLFPARISALGGFAFLVPYIICVIIIGFTGVMEEITFGRAMKAGAGTAYGKAMKLSGKSEKIGNRLSLIPVLGSLALAIGYSVVVGWIIKYLIKSLSGELYATQGIKQLGEMFGSTAASFGNVFFHIIALALTFIIMTFGISKGIEKANKIMMPLFFIMFIGLAIYIATLPGASNGYKYLFSPNWATLTDPKTWMYALGQAFFSLSLAGNGTIVYGSYLNDDVDIKSSSKYIAFFDTLAAIVASIVIIPAMAVVGETLDGGGPGLMFIYLPNVFKSIPYGNIAMIVFFIAVLFAGLSSLVNLFETPIETLQKKLNLTRKKSVGLVALVSTFIGILIEGIVSGWMDICSIYICPIGALIAAIIFFWILDPEYILKQINIGSTKPVGKWFVPMGKYVFCGITVLVLVLGTLFGGIG
ncbi:MAG: sodium-dependent transporter [Eubacteriales bacterium]|jgi:NSS family neurotransmitter:Na+ symporter|nr:sodium-dependent transporter [Eubacteriales bacterium]